MTAPLTRLGINLTPRGWKNPLPGQLAASIRILSAERPGRLDPSGSLTQVQIVKPPYALELRAERVTRNHGQQSRAVPLSHTEPGAFEKS